MGALAVVPLYCWAGRRNKDFLLPLTRRKGGWPNPLVSPPLARRARRSCRRAAAPARHRRRRVGSAESFAVSPASVPGPPRRAVTAIQRLLARGVRLSPVRAAVRLSAARSSASEHVTQQCPNTRRCRGGRQMRRFKSPTHRTTTPGNRLRGVHPARERSLPAPCRPLLPRLCRTSDVVSAASEAAVEPRASHSSCGREPQ